MIIGQRIKVTRDWISDKRLHRLFFWAVGDFLSQKTEESYVCASLLPCNRATLDLRVEPPDVQR